VTGIGCAILLLPVRMEQLSATAIENLSTLQKSDKETQNIIFLRQSSFIKIMCVMGIIFSTIQPAVLYLTTNSSFALSDFLFNVFIFLFSIIYLILIQLEHMLVYIKYSIVTLLLFFVLYLVFGFEHANLEGNIYYLTLLPLFGFFFLGKKGGVFYSCISLIFILILSFSQTLPSAGFYSFTQIFQMISILFAESYILYFYQIIVDQTHTLIKGQTEKLKLANDSHEKTIGILQEQKKQLEMQSKEIQERQRELIDQKADLERLNKLMVGRELKMIELKNRIEFLEKNQLH
jgi:hypothetical protein